MTTGTGASGFEAYVAEHGAALHRYAFVLTGNAADAADLVQTALIKAHRQWRRIEKLESPHGYVRRIVTNCFVDHGRRRRLPESEELLDQPDPDDYVSRSADRDAIVRALAYLSPNQRAVLVLRFFLDLADDDIGRELGCSTSTVRSHASRGLEQLRVLLNYPDLEVHS